MWYKESEILLVWNISNIDYEEKKSTFVEKSMKVDFFFKSGKRSMFYDIINPSKKQNNKSGRQNITFPICPADCILKIRKNKNNAEKAKES